MNINLLYILAAILIVLCLINSPVFVIYIGDRSYAYPNYTPPSRIEGIMPMAIDYINIVLTILLVFSIPVLLIYSFTGRNSKYSSLMISLPTYYIASTAIIVSLVSYIKPAIQCIISPSYILLLLAYMMVSTSDIYNASIVLPNGQRVGILDYLRISHRKGAPKKLESRKKPSEAEEKAPEEKPEEKKEKKEGKEIEKEKEEEKVEEREEEKREEKSDVLSEIAKELLRG